MRQRLGAGTVQLGRTSGKAWKGSSAALLPPKLLPLVMAMASAVGSAAKVDVSSISVVHKHTSDLSI